MQKNNICEDCGADLSYDYEFCPKCGVELEWIEDNIEQSNQITPERSPFNLIVLIILLLYIIVVSFDILSISKMSQEDIILYEPSTDPKINSPIYGNLIIDNIAKDMDYINTNGWQDLYKSGEFDCSKMTTYFWDYIRKKYQILPTIFLAPDRQHAWLAVKTNEVGDTDRYAQWSINGATYYFIEATVPKVVTYEEDIYAGTPPKWYKSTNEYYRTDVYLFTDPYDTREFSGKWSNDFRLTKPDLDKLNTFLE